MIKRGFADLVAEANAQVSTITIEDGFGLIDDPEVVFIDVREGVEVMKSGVIKGAVHVPRGFLEFQTDPKFPGHNPVMASEKRFVLYCATGGRSALAAKTLLEMGIENVCHMAGGFKAWSESAGPTEPVAAS